MSLFLTHIISCTHHIHFPCEIPSLGQVFLPQRFYRLRTGRTGDHISPPVEPAVLPLEPCQTRSNLYLRRQFLHRLYRSAFTGRTGVHKNMAVLPLELPATSAGALPNSQYTSYLSSRLWRFYRLSYTGRTGGAGFSACLEPLAPRRRFYR